MALRAEVEGATIIAYAEGCSPRGTPGIFDLLDNRSPAGRPIPEVSSDCPTFQIQFKLVFLLTDMLE
jgi:hypothetical protein